jgi:carbon starvation protein
MLMESFVAIMALCAACVLDPGIYFAMNSPAAVIGDTPQKAAEVIRTYLKIARRSRSAINVG